jgi:AraC family transcriptional regulator
MPSLRVAAVPHLGAYNRIGEAFQRLSAIAGAAGLLRQGAMMLAIHHDDPETTPVEQLRSEAGLSVPEDVALPKERMMGEWLPGSGLRVGAGPSYELYRSTPAEAREEDLRTDLYIPVL